MTEQLAVGRFTPEAGFAELSRIMFSGEPLSATLREVAEIAKRTIPLIDEVSVTFVEGDQAKTVAFTGDLAMHLDERQYEAGFGPCLDAAMTGQTIVVDASDENSPYPHFTRACARAGVTHSVSIGLPVPQRALGALNMYTSTPAPVDSTAVEVADAFAAYAAVAVANAAMHADTVELARQLRQAMESRAVIEQAKGILMGRHRISADEAFRMLSNASQTRNRKVRDLAHRLVEQVSFDS